VTAGQRKLGLGVIVALDFAPAVGVVAGRALAPEPPAVGFVLAVAVHARGGCLAEFFLLLVATVALRERVLALQLEIGESVIECGRVEPHDIGIAALMIGVTMPAFVGRNVGPHSVQTAFGLDVRCDFLVAGSAQIVLGLGRKRGMAVGATLLEFGMRLDQLAGHDELLEGGLAMGNRRKARDARQCQHP